MSKAKKIHIIFVCLGNICRSPLGEGIFRHLVEKRGLSEYFHIDSAGTASYHTGERPDPGSIRAAAKHGVSLDGQYARQFTGEDMARWDYIIAMDSSNHSNICKLGNTSGSIHLLREFDPEEPGDVPDPWAKGDDAFLETYAIIHRSCVGLLDHIIRVHYITD